MDQEKKIKIGLLLNKINTVLMIAFFLVTCVIVTIDLTLYLVLTVGIAAAFIGCTVASHILLKDYKPQ